MEYRILGRTGLRVSVMGLGAGGHSRLGQAKGQPENDSVRIVKEALDAGINIIDTAEVYGTEAVVGQGIKGTPRDQVVISTKKGTWSGLTEEGIRTSLDASLSNLGTDYVDIYHLHGVAPETYRENVDQAVPVLRKLQEEGKIRFLGITERFEQDTSHEMLGMALDDDFFDVVMVGFNLLNASARRSVFPRTVEQNVGVLVMFAVRRALSDPARMAELMLQLREGRQVSADLGDAPLEFVVQEDAAVSIPDAAYRYCNHEPGVHVVLSGTSRLDHLEDNLASLERPPLAPAIHERLMALFANVDSISGS